MCHMCTNDKDNLPVPLPASFVRAVTALVASANAFSFRFDASTFPAALFGTETLKKTLFATAR